MNDLQALADRIEIGERLALWCEIVDRGAADRMGEVIGDDVVWDLGDGVVDNGLQVIRDKFEAGILRNPNRGATMHLLSNVIVDVDGDAAGSRACCFGAMCGAGPYEGQDLFTWQSYEDTWARTPAGWRITRRLNVMMKMKGQMALVGRPPSQP